MEFFIGYIGMFGGNFAPRNWAYCDGSLINVNDNTALFSILGTTYGGDGRTTFALPDLRGRLPMHPGSGPGLSTRRLGQKGGHENVTLNTNQLPAHSHSGNIKGLEEDANATDLADKALANHTGYHTGTPDTDLVAGTVNFNNTGGGQSHDNVQPFLCVNFIMLMTGIYPSRN